MDPLPLTHATHAQRTAGRRVGLAGLCYIVPLIWGGWMLWPLVMWVVSKSVKAWTSPTNVVIILCTGVAVLAVLPVMVLLTTSAVSLLAAHRQLARTVAAGEPGAATAAFGLVAVELGGWLCAAAFALAEPGGTPRLPRSAAELLPLLMMALSAWLLVSLSRARRATPPPLPAIRFAKLA